MRRLFVLALLLVIGHGLGASGSAVANGRYVYDIPAEVASTVQRAGHVATTAAARPRGPTHCSADGENDKRRVAAVVHDLDFA